MALHPRLGAGGAWRQGCDKAAGAATQASCMMALLDSDVLRYITSLTQDQPECGFLGVRWSRKKNKWRVRIKANGKVGSFL